jgi:hypothetical protein
MPTLRTSVLVGALFASAAFSQSPCFDLSIGTDLNMGDDQIVSGLALGFTFNYNGVGYTSVCLDSNGSIYLGATTTAFADYSPTEAELLSSPQPRICGLWDDFNAGALGSGHIYFNAIPAGGGNPAYALFTWAGVYEYSRTTPINVQVRLDANNAVTVTYGATPPLGGTLNTTLIIGASPGLGAVSNPVSFAARPVTITQNNFADVRTVPNTPAGFKMIWNPTNPGYIASDISCTPNSFPPPATAVVLGVGCPSLAAGLGAGDDTTHVVTLPFSFPHSSGAVTQIMVSSNGFLTLGPSTAAGSGCCSGVITGTTGLLGAPPRIAGMWTDLNEATGGTGNGEVFTGVEAGSGAFTVTWASVGEFGLTPVASNSFQIALFPNGDFAIRYSTVQVQVAGHVVVAGYSVGNGAADPGPTDLSAIGAPPTISTIYETFSTTAPMDLSGLNFLFLATSPTYLVIPGAGGSYSGPIQPLALDSAPGSRPGLGLTYTMNLTGISSAPQGNIALLFIGFTELNPGVDLGAPLGAPGCTAFFLPGPSDLNFLNFTFGAPTTSFSVAVPPNPALAGVVGIAEAVSDDTGANTFGWKFSNGLRLTVGL